MNFEGIIPHSYFFPKLIPHFIKQKILQKNTIFSFHEGKVLEVSQFDSVFKCVCEGRGGGDHTAEARGRSHEYIPPIR